MLCPSPSPSPSPCGLRPEKSGSAGRWQEMTPSLAHARTPTSPPASASPLAVAQALGLGQRVGDHADEDPSCVGQARTQVHAADGGPRILRGAARSTTLRATLVQRTRS